MSATVTTRQVGERWEVVVDGQLVLETSDRTDAERTAECHRMTDAEWIVRLRDLCPLLWLISGGSNARAPFPIFHPLCHLPGGARNRHPEELAEQFDKSQKYAEELLADKKWFSYLFFHEKPYRVAAFDRIRTQMSDADYWKLLARVYQNSDNTCQNKTVWKKLFASKRPGREHFMSDSEREAFAALPEEIKVYRGYHPARKLSGIGPQKSNRVGRSWTLSKDVALDFTRRYFGIGLPGEKGKERFVRELIVDKSEVLGYLKGREEEEILLTRET